MSAGPALGAAVGAAAAVALWLLARWRQQGGLLLRFLAAVGCAWTAVCLAYLAEPGRPTFGRYLADGTLATLAVAAVGVLFYVTALATFEPGERQWRQSSNLLAGVVLMGVAFVRAAGQPALAVPVEGVLAVLVLATVWQFRAEPLVYLAIQGAAAMVLIGVDHHLAPRFGETPAVWTASSASAVALLMVLAAALLGLKRRQEFNVKWHRQGLLIVPLVLSSLSATVAGFAAAWSGPTWQTVWALGAWWAVLLVSSIGLAQPDLFGFSSVGAASAAVAAFAVLGGPNVPGYWGRYPSVLLAMALGAAVLAWLLALGRRRSLDAAPRPPPGDADHAREVEGRPDLARFARALYFAAVAIAAAGVLLEPLETRAHYVGAGLLIAAGVLALAHAHRAAAWVNYLVTGFATAGVAALAGLAPDFPEAMRHQRFIQVASATAVGWLLVALALREILRRTASDRTARRQTEPFAVFGMATTLVLAGYLAVQEVRAYAETFLHGSSPTAELLGPWWGLAGWLAVLLAFLVTMWLFRHTARTFLFYWVGIMATVYVGLGSHARDLYAYLIYAIGGYGAAHLVVYLYEAKFMALLSRASNLYREERRASTTIFSLAVISCFLAAILAAFRLHLSASLIMLGILSAVFLAWAFVWLRGEMLYPAVVMVTLGILSVWHNNVHPTAWTPYRVNVNAAVLAFSALGWFGVSVRLNAIRGEIFQLAGPARACSVILALVGTGFGGALAVGPTFGGEVWRATRDAGDWASGLATLAALLVYFTWARLRSGRRFFDILGAVALLLIGLYVGIYWGVRL